MCLMLYLGTHGDLPLRAAPDLVVEAVETSREAIRQWFSLPTVRFIGAHTGCSCGFPHVVAEEPIEHWDGLLEPGDRRDTDLRSSKALLAIVREHVTAFGGVELYPVWDGNEQLPPKGTIEVSVDSLDPETFLFTEQFFYRVARKLGSDPGMSLRRVFLVRVAIVGLVIALAACDIDLFGTDRRTIAGPYGLFVGEGKYYLILDKWENKNGCGILGGTATELGWNEQVILVHQETCGGNGRSGWMVVNIRSRVIDGPIDPGTIATRPDLRGIRVMSAHAAWDRLRR